MTDRLLLLQPVDVKFAKNLNISNFVYSRVITLSLI